MKHGLVCVGFRMVDLCDVLSFIAIYKLKYYLLMGLMMPASLDVLTIV